jgi:penicillin amidase
MKHTSVQEERRSRRSLKRLLLLALGTLASLTVAVVLAALTFAWWSLPKTSGTLALPGLTAEVRVVRDNWGIPHIYAHNELDAFRAMGFVAAQDRLFQMDIHRRLANGQLSEIVGNAALHQDEIARTFGFRHYAEKLLASGSIKPDVLRAAEAYRDGLNYYISTQTSPIEFKMLGYKPRPFEIVEMLAFAGYMSLDFSEAFDGDLLYSDLLNDVPAEKVNELRGGIEQSAPTITKAITINLDRHLFAESHDDSLAQALGTFNGSNSWVLSPKRSKSGYAILANDPHIGFSKPAIWYEAHISSPTLEIYGHFLSFIPFPILGHTRDIAWAITMSEIDDMDFYREKPGIPLEQRTEKIVVKGASDVSLTIQTGPHGPLIQHLLGDSNKELISVKWQYHEPDNRTLETFFDLAHAKSFSDFPAALRKAKTPGLNISYADKAGNIAWWVMGQIPIRRAESQPDMVLDGESANDEYLGYVPFENNPHALNPEAGVIITANNKSAHDTPYPLHGYFQVSDRAIQIQRLLATQEKWSDEELKKVQTNQQAVFASEDVSLLLGLIAKPEDTLEKNAYAVLQRWDGHSDTASVGTAIYNEWRSQILRGALLDEMGDDRFAVFCKIADSGHFYKRLITNSHSRWWDNVQTKDRIETREQIVTRAFQDAIAVLKQRFGPDITQWTWGKLHTMEYLHPFGRQPQTLLSYIFNAGPYPAGGNAGQIDAMSGPRGQETFPIIYGPSTRRILDFSHIEKTWGVSPLGTSGNLLSRHERDQVDMFLHGEYRPQLMDEAEIRHSSEATLILNPH